MTVTVPTPSLPFLLPHAPPRQCSQDCGGASCLPCYPEPVPSGAREEREVLKSGRSYRDACECLIIAPPELNSTITCVRPARAPRRAAPRRAPHGVRDAACPISTG